MTASYGFSVKGKSHISKGTCCQDNHMIRRMDNGWTIAAVADGVGSAANSHIGSKIAVETAVSMCEELMPWDYSIIGIKSMLRTVFNYAFKQILRESEKSGEPIESYDTTLTLVIYDGHKIIYGHSGDGAIIGLNTFGQFIPVTRPQKGEDHISVVPLRAGYTQWEIDNCEEELAAVLLMTDGVLDAFCPYLLKIGSEEAVPYVSLVSVFADPALFAEGEEQTESNIKEIASLVAADDDYDPSRFYELLSKVYNARVADKAGEFTEEVKKYNFPVSLMHAIQDDKTIVGLINTDTDFDSNEEGYYREPDWQTLQDKWNRLAYPHLYKKADEAKAKATEVSDAADAADANKAVTADADSTGTTEDNAETGAAGDSADAGTTEANAEAGDAEDTSKETPVNAVSRPAVRNRPVELPEKHSRPRKKSVMGKIGDRIGDFIDEFK